MTTFYEVKTFPKDGPSISLGFMPDFGALLRALHDDSTGKPHDRQFGRMRLTYDDAVNVCRRRLQYYIRAGQEAPSMNNPDTHILHVSGLIRVTRKVALEFLKDAYHHHRERVYVDMSLHGNSLFIG